MKIASISIFSILFFIACTTPQVAIDYDRTYDFNSIKTYQFENQDLGISELYQMNFKMRLKKLKYFVLDLGKKSKHSRSYGFIF